jgi:hypothetical protein
MKCSCTVTKFIKLLPAGDESSESTHIKSDLTWQTLYVRIYILNNSRELGNPPPPLVDNNTQFEKPFDNLY